MADFTFHIGDQGAPIQIVHHVEANVPKDGQWYKIEEQLTRRIFIDGVEAEPQKSYVKYSILKQPEHTLYDNLVAGYTHKAEPEINLENRRLEVL